MADAEAGTNTTGVDAVRAKAEGVGFERHEAVTAGGNCVTIRATFGAARTAHDVRPAVVKPPRVEDTAVLYR